MPVSTKASASRSTKNKKKGNWLGNFLARRYAKPTITVVAFMAIGTATVLWAMAATTTSSLWSDSTVPATLSSADASNIEVGLRFKTDVAGYVTGVRFYKSAQNTGTHTGNLWNNKGQLLASVTFSNETASGWQTANFSTPVSVASNTVYTISYHAPNGHYSYNAKYFSKAAYVNGHLTAVKNSSARPNGIYNKSTNPAAYPTTSGTGANYWVDVLFTTSLLNAQAGPSAPTGLSATAPDSSSVQLAWQASVSDNPISNYTVYRGGNKLADVGTALTYTDTTVTAGTTYTYQVKATDSTGLASALSGSVSVTVPAASSSGGGTTGSTTTCPLPKYPDATCTGVPAGTTLQRVPADVTSGDGWSWSAADGQINVTSPSVTLSGLDVAGGIYVMQTGVTIKNTKAYKVSVGNQARYCQVGEDPYLASDSGCTTGVSSAGSDPRLILEDSEINCDAGGATGGTAIMDRNINVYRVNIHGCENGFDMDGYAIIEDSYIHDLYQSEQAHTDGLQTAHGNNMLINHNTFYGFSTGCVWPNNSGTNCNGTSAIGMGAMPNYPSSSNTTVSNNLLAGGAFALYCPSVASPNFQVLNNHFSTIYSPKVGEYGIVYNGCPGAAWSGNVIHETGAAVTPDM